MEERDGLNWFCRTQGGVNVMCVEGSLYSGRDGAAWKYGGQAWSELPPHSDGHVERVYAPLAEGHPWTTS